MIISPTCASSVLARISMVLLSVVEEQSEQDQEDDPGSEQDEPGSVQDDPGSEQDEPGSVQDDPVSEQDEPGSVQDDPGSEQDEPGTEQDEPGSIQPDGSRWPIKTILTVYLNMKQVYCLLVFIVFNLKRCFLL